MTSPKSSLFPSEYSALSIARILWKSKLLIGAIWVAITFIAAVVILLLPSVYKSEALILVDSQKIPERYVSSTVNAELQDRIATISQQILSSTRLKKIIEDFDLYHQERKSRFEEEILEMMRRDISITFEKGWAANRPGAFRIGYQGMVPQVVAQVANRIANLYIEENLKNREVQAEGTAEFLQNQVRNAKNRLDELEKTVSAYKMQHNGELPEQQPMLLGMLSRLQTDLEANRDALNRAYQNKVALDNTLKILEASVAAREWGLAHDELPVTASGAPAVRSKPVTRVQILQAQLAALRIRYSDDYPDVKRLREDIERLKQLDEGKAEVDPEPAQPNAETQSAPDTQPEPAAAPPAEPGAVPAAAASKAEPDARKSLDINQDRLRIAGLRAEMALNAKEIEARTAEQERIRRDMGVWQKKLGQLPVREREYAEITRDYEISRANYKSLLDKALSADMATDLEHRQKSERFTILDAARIPEKPVKPDRPLLITLGSVFGIVMGLIAGLGRELRGDLFLGEWELPPSYMVLARLPRIVLPGSTPAPRRLTRWLKLSLAFGLVLALAAVGTYFAMYRV